MTQFPTWAAGQRVTAGRLQQMQWIDAVKGAATGRASNTTVAADPDLVLSLGTGTYEFEGFLNYTGGVLGSSDLKLAMVYSGTSSYGVWAVNGVTTGGTTQAQMGGNGLGTAGTIIVGTNGGAFLSVDIKGLLITTGSGTLSVYWSQNTSSATATTLRQGCWTRARQIA